MRTIQFLLFLAFISGSSILMINSGRVSPQIEQQHNRYWTVIANDQSEPASGLDIPEPEKFLSPAGIATTRSTSFSQGTGSGNNRNLSEDNPNLSQKEPLNPLHSRIIQATLQPIDLIISPKEAAEYTATLESKMHFITKR